MQQIIDAYEHWPQLKRKLIPMFGFDPSEYDSWEQIQAEIDRRSNDDSRYYERIRSTGGSTTELPLMAAVLARADYAALADEMMGTFFSKSRLMNAEQTQALLSLLRR